MCSNFSEHQGVVDFCLFKCNYHPLERLWAAKFLKSGRWTCDSSRNKSMDYFTECLRWKGPTRSPAPQGMAQVGIRAVPWLSLAPISDQLSQAQARSWALSHVCSYSTPISMDLKLPRKHRNWELQFLTQLCLLAASWTSKNNLFVAPQVTMKSCPAKLFISIPRFPLEKTQVCSKVELEGSPNIPDRAGTRRRQMSLTWIHVELPWGQQDSTETQNPDGENLVQSQSWFWVFSDVIVSL